MLKTMKIRHFFTLSNPVAAAFFLGFVFTASCAFWLKKEQPGCVVSNDLNNEMVVGLDNPLTILARNIPTEKLSVTATGATLEKRDDIHFTARVQQAGAVLINVSDGGKFNQTFRFLAKPIFDPVPLLGAKHRSKEIGNGEFKAQAGIAAVIECCDIDARCEVVEYDVTYRPKEGALEDLPNKGARFETQVQELVNKALPGDTYFFSDIQARCPGDKVARNLGKLVFHIK